MTVSDVMRTPRYTYGRAMMASPEIPRTPQLDIGEAGAMDRPATGGIG